uniref:Uncharacterized protein n=1 Tax=Timema tahoe TaxID=61484 RepID=A0A7R9FLG9_9NEOP|nr:unnamed protein product [Timema tahoe]
MHPATLVKAKRGKEYLLDSYQRPYQSLHEDENSSLPLIQSRQPFWRKCVNVAAVSLLLVSVVGIIAWVLVGIYSEKKCCSSSTNGLSESFLPRLYSSRQQFLLVNRSTWEARPAYRAMEANLTAPANHVIVAHTGSAPCVTLSECSKITRVIQGFQMDDLGYADIAYNFLVGGDSQVYEGRGWDTQGALAAHYNNVSLGVAFIGIFEKTAPLMQQLEEFQTFLNVSVEKGKLSADYKLIGHRQVSITDSPGQALHDIIRTWPHWEDCYMKTCL